MPTKWADAPPTIVISQNTPAALARVRGERSARALLSMLLMGRMLIGEILDVKA